uniref:Reverse transcriptase domain-containing protein n=1 Tax=Trichobilharzia regenti TaxID=157069 RepID=A0AA85KBW2_TRIRE|nr:unnamed protein product [Trichobilharzia regenti]
MNVHFFFNNSYYRQVHGIAMGSPLGPILAEFFLAKLENGKLKDIIKEFDIYYRYVDDTFILADGNVNIDELLLKFNNNIYPSLTFTCELNIIALNSAVNGRLNGGVVRISLASKIVWSSPLLIQIKYHCGNIFRRNRCDSLIIFLTQKVQIPFFYFIWK